ncbi:hypothetical protein [Sinorhizobium meliloti]|uniref:hypothetical protein n=1 Tax=Rhizobium meliloti TaxID=382 RepID=UPI0004F8F143|nr:hypothetical protein [Sinorhizobium meliloti]AIL99473.1 hypothetical protein DU99_08725 [Sinorhizobium meliloti]MDE3771048.1 hypothetical protein [Sinorhizobium meliloti]MDW9532208.1 hypothetical protein [Sinorhizobium meliloti]MDW9618398.1 hypothetical protein [Sinorhizobium meliloti]RVE80154.1 hypothetical protein CN240_19550 [Sinorhizobium meliloti]
MTERTTAEHRAAVEAWRATAPKHDHHIFGRKMKTEKPRHRDMSEPSALLAMRSRPAGVAEGVPAEQTLQISSNWRLTPANDNKQPEDGFGAERAVEYTPSEQELENSFAKVIVRYRPEPMMLAGGRHEAQRAGREIHAIPVEGDFGYGTHVDQDGNQHKVITRIGKLRFSDGTQTERGHKLVLEKVVEAQIDMPVGAMLGGREKSKRDKGGEEDSSGSNTHYRWMVDGRTATPPKLRPKKQEREKTTKAEDRQALADAYANTPVMPDIKRYPDGFPASPTNLRQLFIGGRKGKNGESGSQAWQDIYTEKENREKFQRGLDAMQDSHVRVLTEAVSAKSLAELGETRGYKGRHAIDAGRRLLRAANDNFLKAMELAEYGAEPERREVSRS